jgi:ABC-type antimicrobial peptide transport system permease subunit
MLVGTGLAIGLAVSIYAARFVETLLFGLAPTDVTTLVGAILLLAFVGFVAGWIPALRASRLDPAASLARS